MGIQDGAHDAADDGFLRGREVEDFEWRATCIRFESMQLSKAWMDGESSIDDFLLFHSLIDEGFLSE